MAGIYIPGMKIPKDGAAIFGIRPDGIVEDVMGCFVGKAIHVPDHGRLGDLDELEKRIRTEGINQAEQLANSKHPVVMAYGDCYGKCIDAPTIIPADKEVHS